MTDFNRVFLACFLAIVASPAWAQVIYDPCLRPGPNGEALRSENCPPPKYDGAPVILHDLRPVRIPREFDYWLNPRPAKEGERCTRMTRQFFVKTSDDPADYAAFAQEIERQGFRHRVHSDGRVGVLVPVFIGGPTIVDIVYGFRSFHSPGHRYVGWEYAAVSGCR
jgi:hypothetical protein